jgi:hypothetical protein
MTLDKLVKNTKIILLTVFASSIFSCYDGNKGETYPDTDIVELEEQLPCNGDGWQGCNEDFTQRYICENNTRVYELCPPDTYCDSGVCLTPWTGDEDYEEVCFIDCYLSGTIGCEDNVAWICGKDLRDDCTKKFFTYCDDYDSFCAFGRCYPNDL